MTTTTEILDAALHLSLEDRARLTGQLLHSLNESKPQPTALVEEEWKHVVKDRQARLHSGEVTPVSWDEIQKKAHGYFAG